MHKEKAFESLGSIWSPCFRRTVHTEILFSFHLFPSKGKRGAYPFCFLTTSSLKFLAYYTALTYQKQDAFLYCQPFHLKCKLILTQCALTKIKVGTLTFPGPPPLPPPPPPSLEPLTGGQGRVPKGAGERRAGGGDLALFPPALLRAALIWHMEHLSRLHTLCKCPPLKPLVNNAAEWVNMVLVWGKPLCRRRLSL